MVAVLRASLGRYTEHFRHELYVSANCLYGMPDYDLLVSYPSHIVNSPYLDHLYTYFRPSTVTITSDVVREMVPLDSNRRETGPARNPRNVIVNDDDAGTFGPSVRRHLFIENSRSHRQHGRTSTVVLRAGTEVGVADGEELTTVGRNPMKSRSYWRFVTSRLSAHGTVELRVEDVSGENE